jgi:ABC-type lipoprotein export system ATPase subunit
VLELHDLIKQYRRPGRDGQTVDALGGVSLRVDPGEMVAVQGPSGCGKTTLLLAAGGLLSPDAGHVRVDGTDPYGLSPDRRARFRADRIGFVFQQFHLIPYLSLRDNVLAPSMAGGGDRAAIQRRADALIERFQLAPRAPHVPAELSTGERQRAALARALLNEPKLILADEPTGNLDEANGAAVMTYLADFARNGGAVLVVTHETADRVTADRVVRLEQGKLVGEDAAR